MSLGMALVDRARPLRQVAGEKVEGRRKLVETPGQWFRCRLTPTEAGEAGEFATATLERPELLYGVRDGDGAPVRLDAGDRVEVQSKPLALALGADTTVFEVEG